MQEARQQTLEHALRPGDRLELYKGNQFGTLVEHQPISHGNIFLVRLEDGRQVRLTSSQAWYAPDPAVLRCRCGLVQACWSTSDKRRHAGLGPERHDEGYAIPVIHDHRGELAAEFGEVV